MNLPVLYSFRRCPYAIRARMALHYAGVEYELREVSLGNKPAEMLQASPKGTVPVMCLPDKRVVDESREVMHWAVARSDPDHWWQDSLSTAVQCLVDENDGQFKTHLDRFKYWERYPEQSQQHYREQAEAFFDNLELRLGQCRYLFSDSISFADVAIFPFVRQFAFVDIDGFMASPYPKLQLWLQWFLDSSLFQQVMQKAPAWKTGDAPLRISPGSILHE